MKTLKLALSGKYKFDNNFVRVTPAKPYHAAHLSSVHPPNELDIAKREFLHSVGQFTAANMKKPEPDPFDDQSGVVARFAQSIVEFGTNSPIRSDPAASIVDVLKPLVKVRNTYKDIDPNQRLLLRAPFFVIDGPIDSDIFPSASEILTNPSRKSKLLVPPIGDVDTIRLNHEFESVLLAAATLRSVSRYLSTDFSAFVSVVTQGNQISYGVTLVSRKFELGIAPFTLTRTSISPSEIELLSDGAVLGALIAIKAKYAVSSGNIIRAADLMEQSAALWPDNRFVCEAASAFSYS